jgi:serine/threonine protein phosphatase PrpC
LKGEQALRITVDHKASCGDEIKRILAGGGMIYNNRVAGALAVTRSIGDLDFKKCVSLNIQKNFRVLL